MSEAIQERLQGAAAFGSRGGPLLTKVNLISDEYIYALYPQHQDAR
jgi:hypothetical protein